MEGGNARMRAAALCGRLAKLTQMPVQTGRVHSVFAHAVNLALDGREGLISLVRSDRTLPPYAVSVETPYLLNEAGVSAGMAAAVGNGKVEIPQAGISLDCSRAERADLRLDSVQAANANVRLKERVPVLLDLLRETDGDGLSPLVTGRGGNVYSCFLENRVAHLVQAVAGGEAQRAALAAERIAGCGPGLTPSSDDLLNGYLGALRVIFNAQGTPQKTDMLRVMAERAAGMTNRISASFLLACGEGLAARDYLALLTLIFSDADDARIKSAAKAVLSVGSTSGGDMLTGLVLALTHHTEG